MNDKPEGGWGKLPRAWFTHGDLPKLKLSRNETNVLLIIVAWRNGRTETCHELSIADIAAMSCISVRNVHSILKRLETMQLITIERRAGRGKTNVFRILEKVQKSPDSCTLSREPICTISPPEKVQKSRDSCTTTPEKVQKSRDSCTPIKNLREESSSSTVAAAAAIPLEVIQALIVAGIESPSRLLEETLAIPGMASMPPQTIRRIAEACRKSGKGVPIIKREIANYLAGQAIKAAGKRDHRSCNPPVRDPATEPADPWAAWEIPQEEIQTRCEQARAQLIAETSRKAPPPIRQVIEARALADYRAELAKEGRSC